MKDRMSILEFYKRFPNEDACGEFIEQERWNGEPVCTHCGHKKAYRVKGTMGYKCASCRKRFSVRHGTIMEGSKLPLQTWLLAIYMMTTARKGISSVQFAKELGVTQKTAWFLANRIRKACADGGSLLGSEVEGGSTVYTDEHGGYVGLCNHKHLTVCHSAGEYVNGQACTNGIESFWALLKRGYYGTHHWWSVKHTHRYVAEYAYRQNTIGLSGVPVLASVIRGGERKRLKYAELIA